MMKRIILLTVYGLISCTFARAQNQISLPNGWQLSPAGRSVALGDLPLNMAVSPSKKFLAVTNNGQSKQSLQLIDIRSEKVLSTVDIPKSWLGIAFSADEKYLYASGGNDNRILKYSTAGKQLKLVDSIALGKPWPNKISPTGMALYEKMQTLYVVTKDDNSLYIIDLESKKVKNKIALEGEAYTCLLSPDKRTLYISCWGGNKIILVDTQTEKISGNVLVGNHPNELCIDKKGAYLYVANANDNSVSVIDTRKKNVIETLSASLYPDAPPGSTTNGVALSETEKTLFIANADNNCLAVFDVSTPGNSKSQGFIPTGWYPTCVKVVGEKILVSNGKGMSSMANPYGPNPVAKKQQVNFQRGDENKPVEVQYIGGLFKGSLSFIDFPNPAQLGSYAQQVYANTPYSKAKELIAEGEPNNPIPQKVGDVSPIKYVFYIVKENRTYDQVLGDVPGGNGDTSLVLFGEKITPNQHKLAKEFVLLDNFYVDGEVSADGHNWSLGAYANDYLEKNWVTSYGGRGGGYDAEGTREIANNKNGFLWDHAKRAGVTFRTYGEFADDYKANIPVLEGNFCPYYTSWDQSIRDTTRVGQWKKDFDSLVKANALPQLNTLRLINDHTEGLSLNKPTPFAHVADNDLSVGMFLEILSNSPVWKESVVFILEDDAQDGPDHVDAHRSTAYIAGPHVKRNFIDHTPYTTSGMLRTIELILGIPPMSQYDAAATPMWRSFTNQANFTPFTALPAQVNLNDKNTVQNELSKQSALFDFSKEDRAPDREFNEVLWKAVKGENAVMPAPKRAGFVKQVDRDKD
jgi:YVTN family beta-propeller protein